jgi:hypothetical protein
VPRRAWASAHFLAAATATASVYHATGVHQLSLAGLGRGQLRELELTLSLSEGELTERGGGGELREVGVLHSGFFLDSLSMAHCRRFVKGSGPLVTLAHRARVGGTPVPP